MVVQYHRILDNNPSIISDIGRCASCRQIVGSGPAVVRSQLDTEQIAHLAIEVGEAGLWARDDADLDGLAASQSERRRSAGVND